LKERDLTSSEFAKRVRVGTSFVRWIMIGARPLPEKRIEPWADELHLTGKERERFLEAAYLTHCPEYVVNLVKRLRQ
jgi:hypothetical protein